jgi:hypothetical protein
MATPVRSGSEILVNPTTLNAQFNPAIAALSDGRFVTVWEDQSATGLDNSSSAIRAQIFNGDGTISRIEFLVNTTVLNAQYTPAVTALTGGRFVITWQDFSQTGGDTSSGAIRAQIFNGDSTRAGNEFLVNTTTVDNQEVPAIATLDDGNFVITWQSSISSALGIVHEIRAQVFNSNGTFSGTEILVKTPSTGPNNYINPAIAALADGRFVMTWQNLGNNGTTSFSDVFGQVFNQDGTRFGSEFRMDDTLGGFKITPTVTALTNGSFVVVAEDRAGALPQDPSASAILAQVFNGDGTPISDNFLVNTTTDIFQEQPSVTALNDGQFVVTWQNYSLSGRDIGYSIRSQVFDGGGNRIGGEFLVNTTTTGDQLNPTVTALTDGRFAIAWQDSSQTGGDTSSLAVRAQIFDPRSQGLSWFGTLLGEQFTGTFLNDTLDGFLGNDSILGGSGQDVIDGNRGNDTLRGNAGNDKLLGGENDDILRGDAGLDQLYGGNGNDTLNGGSDLDYLEGNNGNDLYVVDNLEDFVEETATGGTDTVGSSVLSLNLANYTNIENILLQGSANLNATGNNQSNSLIGNNGTSLFNGNNILDGSDGNDTLTGGVGADRLIGGLGNDTFRVNAIGESRVSIQRDRILDFQQGQDLIDLRGIDAIAGGGG